MSELSALFTVLNVLNLIAGFFLFIYIMDVVFKIINEAGETKFWIGAIPFAWLLMQVIA